MLGGIDPVIIFYRYKKLDADELSVEKGSFVVSKKDSYLSLPPIPIYLSEALSGVQIDTETKNVDIETETQTLQTGAEAQITQKGIVSSITVSLTAKKDAIGISILSAFIDELFDKVTSKEYAITYIHGATTIFLGLLHSFEVDQDSGTDLLRIKIGLSKGAKQPTKPQGIPPVGSSTGTIPLIPGAGS